MNFGIDFSGGTPTPFLGQGTKLELSAGFGVENFQVGVSVLGIAATLGPGPIGLHGASDASKDASLVIALDGSSDVLLEDLTLGSFTITHDAKLSASLPIGVGTEKTATPLTVSYDLASGAPTIHVPPDLLDVLLQGGFNFDTLIAGLDTFLGLVEEGLRSKILDSLPIIGGDLSNVAAFVDGIRTDLLEPLRATLKSGSDTLEDDVRKKIFDVLGSGPGGL